MSTTAENVPGGAQLDAWLDQKLDELLPKKLEKIEAQRTPSMSIIATKGTLDWAYPPFILASTAAALGWEVDVFFTFYGLLLLKKKIAAEVSPLGNPAMPMKMPFGPKWFQDFEWPMPNLLMAGVPGFEKVATGPDEEDLQEQGCCHHRGTAFPVPRGRCEDGRLPDDRGCVRLRCQRIHPRGHRLRGRHLLPAGCAKIRRLPVYLKSAWPDVIDRSRTFN